jgi:hypothetical protein
VRQRAKLSLTTLESRITPVRNLHAVLMTTDPAPVFASVRAPMWDQLAAVPPAPAAKQSFLNLTEFLPYSLNTAPLTAVLKQAPAEASVEAADSTTIIGLPKPDGTLAHFRIVSVEMMEPGLAAQFPDITTYRGQGIEDPSAVLAADKTPLGFHAQVISPNGAWYIDPYFHLDTSVYASYFASNLQAPPDLPSLGDDIDPMSRDLGFDSESSSGLALNRSTGTQLRIYRLACAATGEYTAFFGGTVSAGQAAIVTAINRVSAVYETELTIRMTLIANNSSVVYTNASTDPYTNNNGSTMLGQNQSNLDSVIGTGNYDIGHVFSTGGGGIAGLGVVGVSGQKARGVTGLPSPTGDAFYIDFVAHEMGHQFGGNHSFNTSSDPNRNASTAYEPGSGSTIMSYAGITGANSDLQAHSDPYFHSVSYNEILAFVDTSIPGVGTRTATGNNFPTLTVTTPGPYTIPTNTPFYLTASASDLDGDTLTYDWQQRNLGAANLLNSADNGSSPLFRNQIPSTSGTRFFPKLASILNNSNPTGNAEKLPTVAWPGAGTVPMRFRVMVRDNRAGGGGVNESSVNNSNTDSIAVSVVNTGAAFSITSQNSATSYAAGSTQTVTWNVAGTTGSGINTANVKISLSTDGGANFSTVLAASTPNDGTESITIPSTVTSLARIKVEAVGNIFFDINNANVSITAAPPHVSSVVVNDGSSSQHSMVSSIKVTFDSTVSFSGGATAAFSLSRIGGSAVGLNATASVVGGVTVVTIDGFSGPDTYAGGGLSWLQDGRYSLTIAASQVTTAGGQLAGQTTFTDVDGLFRMFGDINGDQTVNGFDFGSFKDAFGTQLGDPGYQSYFDYDADTVINGFDFGQFRNRFGTVLP